MLIVFHQVGARMNLRVGRQTHGFVVEEMYLLSITEEYMVIQSTSGLSHMVSVDVFLHHCTPALLTWISKILESLQTHDNNKLRILDQLCYAITYLDTHS